MKTPKRLKDKVEAILQEYPDAKNSDKKLVAYVWWKFYPQFIQQQCNDYLVNLKHILELPSSDSITRVRRKFQQDGKYQSNKQVEAKREAMDQDIKHSINQSGWDSHLPL